MLSPARFLGILAPLFRGSLGRGDLRLQFEHLVLRPPRPLLGHGVLGPQVLGRALGLGALGLQGFEAVFRRHGLTPFGVQP